MTVDGRIVTDAGPTGSRRGRRPAADEHLPTPADLVLASPTSERGDETALLVAVSRALGAAVVLLPDDPDLGARIVATARLWHRHDAEGLVRDVEAVVSLVDAGPDDGGSLRCLRGAVVRRWARRAWTPCGWCPGGGVCGARCARCRARIEGRAA